MTQHDETGQSAATDQSVPPPPSPYLDASESAPQAYLAPPQAGQPKYGVPSSYGPRVPGADPYAQRGYRRQPGYGQPESRPLVGMRSRRDPSIALTSQRLFASILDWIIIFGISVLAFWSPLVRVWRELQAISNTYQDIGSPAAQAAFNNIARDPANQHALLYWFLGMFGIAVAYYWVQHAAWGATIGKLVLGVRVVQAGDQARIGVWTAGLRAVAFLVGPAAFLLLVSPFNVAGGLLWAADTAFPLFDLRAQCLHDKLAGTVVVRKRWLDQQAGSAGRG
jgi:uncharacterized RDD family membrane protein YckC